jgi:TBC1 domain family member 15
MVEITRPPLSRSIESLSESPNILVYSRSKVYIHPTAYSRDNISGWLALVKKVCGRNSTHSLTHDLLTDQDTFNPTYLLAWIPESLLTEKGPEEWAKFYQVEQSSNTNERALDDDGSTPLLKTTIEF